MGQGLPWEANRSSATQEIPRAMWNSKVYHRIHKRPPSVRILSQIRTVHASPAHFFHSNMILPSMLTSSNFSLSVRFLHQNHGWISPLPYTCYMPRPSHSFRFDHPNNIWWRVQITELLIMYFSPFACYLVFLRSKYSPQHSFLKHPLPTFLPPCERPSFIYIQNSRQNCISLYLNLQIFGQQTGRRKILHRMIASIPWLQSALNSFLNGILIL